MTPAQYIELLKYIYENNGWNNLCEVTLKRRHAVKYVTCSFDTRDGKIWRVTLYPSGDGEGHVFVVDDEAGIERIYEYLNERKGDLDA